MRCQRCSIEHSVWWWTFDGLDTCNACRDELVSEGGNLEEAIPTEEGAAEAAPADEIDETEES